MKSMLVGLMLLVSMSSFASDKTDLVCTYDGGGYDDETITANLTNGEVSSVEYISYQGAVGPFKKLSKNLFQYTAKDIIINEIISIAADHKSATLVVTYKNNGDILTTQDFTCQ